MIRKIALGAAAALLVVGLPVAALGISNSLSSTDVPEAQTAAAATLDDTAPATMQDQAQTRQRLRLHAETGVPEGVAPTQTRQRLHAQDQTGTQSRGQQGHGKGQQGRNRDQGGNRQGPPSGNGGRNGGDTPGECTNPDGPLGNGPNGSSN